MKTNNIKLTKYASALLFSTFIFFACSKKDAPDKSNLKRAELISPEMQEQGIETDDINLKWESPTDSEVTYDIYLDTDNPATTKLVENWESTSYRIPTQLDYGTTYYWRVITKDGKGGESESKLGVFSTRKKTAQELIIGKWFRSEVVEAGVSLPVNDCEKKSFLQFLSDGSNAVVLYGDRNGTSSCEISSNSAGQYHLTDETILTIKSNGKESKFSILSLTETELKVSADGYILTHVKKL